MTSFGTQEDLLNFMDKYKGDPMLKGRPRGGVVGIGVGGVVDPTRGIRYCLHPIGSGNCKHGGGGGSGGGGGGGSITGTGSSAVITTKSSGSPNVEFNPLFFKPQDADVDPNWILDPSDPTHPVKKAFDDAVEFGLQSAVEELLTYLIEFARVPAFLANVIVGVLSTTETSKKATLLSSTTQNIYDIDGNLIGKSTVLWHGDDTVTHVITDANDGVWRWEEDSTPESQQVNLWEFRDEQRPSDAKEDLKVDDEGGESEEEPEEDSSDTDESGDSGGGNEEDGGDDVEIIWMASIQDENKKVDLNYGEPILFVYA